jgi:hypothetical protein
VVVTPYGKCARHADAEHHLATMSITAQLSHLASMDVTIAG